MPIAPYTGPAARFEGESVTHATYKAFPPQPRAAYVPPPPMVASAPFDGRTTQKEAFKGWVLPPRRTALGVAVSGDLMHVMIPGTAPLPAKASAIFTNTHDNQTEICVLVLAGDAPTAAGCSVLGQFDLVGLPPCPANQQRIQVTLFAGADGMLQAEAIDLDTARHEQWLREGAMVARTPTPLSTVQ